MGLFERKTTPFTIPLYSLGTQRTKLVVGLGNIGKDYALNRHNIGFLCVDDFVAQQGGEWVQKKALKCHMTELRLGDKKVVFIKPTTMMNLSGQSVLAVKKFFKIENKDILVVHDELSIPFGSLRFRLGGSDAGNNGIKSVSQTIGEDYPRLRIGTANETLENTDTADFVLKNFSKAEQGSFKQLFKETNALITEFIYSDHLLPDTRKFV